MNNNQWNKDQTPTPEAPSGTNTQPGTPPSTYRDWREQRRAERWARREARWRSHGGSAYGWIGGAILIFLGVIFLLENLHIAFLQNWWALFIMIPALGAYAGAWNLYRVSGKFTQGVAGSLTGALLLTGLSLIFLFNLAIGLFWPLFLIAGGTLLLAAAFWPR
jgi:hypothetical protein